MICQYEYQAQNFIFWFALVLSHHSITSLYYNLYIVNILQTLNLGSPVYSKRLFVTKLTKLGWKNIYGLFSLSSEEYLFTIIRGEFCTYFQPRMCMHYFAVHPLYSLDQAEDLDFLFLKSAVGAYATKADRHIRI